TSHSILGQRAHDDLRPNAGGITNRHGYDGGGHGSHFTRLGQAPFPFDSPTCSLPQRDTIEWVRGRGGSPVRGKQPRPLHGRAGGRRTWRRLNAAAWPSATSTTARMRPLVPCW